MGIGLADVSRGPRNGKGSLLLEESRSEDEGRKKGQVSYPHRLSVKRENEIEQRLQNDKFSIAFARLRLLFCLVDQFANRF